MSIELIFLEVGTQVLSHLTSYVDRAYFFRSWYTSTLFDIYLCYFNALCDLVLFLLFVITSYYQEVFNQILDNISLKIIKQQKSNTCIPLYFFIDLS